MYWSLTFVLNRIYFRIFALGVPPNIHCTKQVRTNYNPSDSRFRRICHENSSRVSTPRLPNIAANDKTTTRTWHHNHVVSRCRHHHPSHHHRHTQKKQPQPPSLWCFVRQYTVCLSVCVCMLTTLFHIIINFSTHHTLC